MNHLIKTLQSKIAGEVSTTADDIDYYSSDGSVFELTPAAIVFPKDANDVANIVKETIKHNLNGADIISLTARGNGTDQGGGPINTGLIVDFMRHMDHILEIGDDYVLVQPGCLYGRMQDELKKQGRFIPSYPASIEVSTVGGAVANNAAGEKTVKYGATRKYVESLQVVLANGETTWIYAVEGEELERKKQIPGLEGKIYQMTDSLISNNYDRIMSGHPHTTKESAGYALWKTKSGQTLDLAQLITGSQGTLCFVTAIRFKTIELPDPSKVTLMVSYYNDLKEAGESAQELHALDPSALEIVDKNLVELVKKQKPELLEGLLPEGDTPAVILLTEFDDKEDQARNNKVAKAQSIIDKHAYESTTKTSPEEEAQLWKLRRSAAAVMWTIPGSKKALPIIEDGTVPPNKLVEFLTRAYEIFDKYDLEIAVWGHAGDADLHMQPFMDLSVESDRKKLFDMTDDFYAMVHDLGGTAAGEHNDSLMRAPYRPLMFGEFMESLFNHVKNIFDEDNLFNPHKKVGVDFNYIKQHLRHEYSIKSLAKFEQQKAQDAIDR